MDIEIDQSIRIREAQDTVLAFSNNRSRAIVIPRSVKRAAEKHLKRRYRKPRNIEMRIFIAGIFLLIKEDLSPRLHLTIDEEWPGQANESTIKGILLNYIRETLPDFDKDQIRFAQIGKQSRAHHRAYAVHTGAEEPDYVVSEKELLELL